MRIHFFSDVFAAVASSDLKVPNVFQCTGQFDSGHLSSRVSFIHFADISLLWLVYGFIWINSFASNFFLKSIFIKLWKVWTHVSFQK